MRSVRPLGFIAVLSLALAGCQGEGDAGAEAQQQGAPPPSQVGVVEVTPEPIPVVSQLPGRVSPTRIAEVRPRVGGIVTERVFEQGTFVEQGTPLFQIDPATFQVAVQAAEATVARAEAVLLQARQEGDRTRTLVQSNTVSAANLDAVNATQAQAEADVATARAQLAQATIELDYATVRAPISGQIGRALVTEGALVSPTGTEALATIQQLDPVYADIQQPVSELLRLREALASGTLERVAPDAAGVKMLFDDGTPYPQTGRLLFSEATVDPTSGQVTLRAEFPNENDLLLPGMYVRVTIEQGVQDGALAVPNQSVQRDAAGNALVWVVNAENTVEQRAVTVARVVGNRSVISEGVAAGDRVIADGFQKTGPGAPVSPVPWDENAATTPVGTDQAAPAEGPAETAGEVPAAEAAPAPAGGAAAATAPAENAGENR